MTEEGYTDFGYQRVSLKEKRQQVNHVFTRVASVYDLMNDAMSLGLHRLWKHQAINALDCLPNHKVIDLACGTGDISERILAKIPNGHLTCIDPNSAMLTHCQQRLAAYPMTTFVENTAEGFSLPNVNRLITSFGLRNFTDPLIALHNIYEHLLPGGKCVIIEFNPPESTEMPNSYQQYLQRIVPLLGTYIAKDTDSYQYLCDSICLQPSPSARIETLKICGFQEIRYTPLSAGIVGLFEAYRLP